MRKAINFFRSYYDVAKELNDKDRLKFYDALLSKQFENIDLPLDGMVKFAYLSQKHSIDTQLKGYYDKTKDEKFNPNQGGCVDPRKGGSQGGCVDPRKGGSQGGCVDPRQQEKEKEKEKEEEYNIIPENKFSDEVISFYNEIIGYFNLTQSHTQTTKEKWLDCIDKLVRIDNLNFDQIKVIVKWARNDEFWKTNFLSILKLRNKNKDDIKYWEIFKEKSNVEYNKNNQQEILSKEVDIFARFRKS